MVTAGGVSLPVRGTIGAIAPIWYNVRCVDDQNETIMAGYIHTYLPR